MKPPKRVGEKGGGVAANATTCGALFYAVKVARVAEKSAKRARFAAKMLKRTATQAEESIVSVPS